MSVLNTVHLKTALANNHILARHIASCVWITLYTTWHTGVYSDHLSLWITCIAIWYQNWDFMTVLHSYFCIGLATSHTGRARDYQMPVVGIAIAPTNIWIGYLPNTSQLLGLMCLVTLLWECRFSSALVYSTYSHAVSSSHPSHWFSSLPSGNWGIVMWNKSGLLSPSLVLIHCSIILTSPSVLHNVCTWYHVVKSMHSFFVKLTDLLAWRSLKKEVCLARQTIEYPSTLLQLHPLVYWKQHETHN